MFLTFFIILTFYICVFFLPCLGYGRCVSLSSPSARVVKDVANITDRYSFLLIHARMYHFAGDLGGMPNNTGD